MRLEDWQTCETLFHRARELSEQERPAFLDEHCGSSGELRRLLESLLRHNQSEDFLAEPAMALISTSDSFMGPHGNAATPLLAGTHLGAYRLDRLLGSGAFGEVWEAEDTASGRRVALKVLARLRAPEDSSTGTPSTHSPQQMSSFHREGQLAARINHPRSVYVFGAEEIDGLPVISMELMRGGTIEDRLRVHGKLKVSEAVDFMLDVVEGLEAAQQVGIVHRDVKPSNCFIDDEGRARIGDFGIALALQHETSSSGGFVGTPAYASPEQVRGHEIDVRSDIYSVGATLYTLLTGKRPFEGKQAAEILSRILSEAPIPLASHGVPLPKGLRRVVERCLAKDPARRYRDYTALRKALLSYSSTAATPGKLASRVTAFVLDEFVVMVGLFAVAQTLLSGWAAEVAVSLTHAAYYGFFEIVWGRTPGKYFMGLNIVDASGVTMNRRQAAVRSLTFGLIVLPLILAELWAGPALLLRAVTLLAYMATMRRDNGFAGPHELLSGTRVIGLKRPDVAVSEASPAPGDPRQAATEQRVKFGPFETLGEAWQRENETLLLAFEPVLQRKVWIHTRKTNQPENSNRLAAVRPGKLRWLQGGRDELNWDAFEVPRGESLWERVRKRGPLPWVQVRSILLAVATELNARIASGENPLLSLQHIWINALEGSHAVAVKVLEFPAAIEDSSKTSIRIDADNAKDFIYEILFFAVTGTILSRKSNAAIAVPLPEHAQAFARRLGNRYEKLSISSLQQELRKLASQPAEVQRPRRVAMLAMAALVPVALVVTYAAAPLIDAVRLPQWQRELQRVPIYATWSNLLENHRTREAEDANIAVCKMLAWIGREASEAPGGRRLLGQMRPFDRTRLETCRTRYATVTEDEAMEARQVAEAFFIGQPIASRERALRLATLRQGLDLVFWAGGTLFLVPVLLATLFPPGLCGRAVGVRLQTMQGGRPGPMRRAIRAVCAWFPFVLFYPLLATAAYFGYAPNAHSYWQREGFLAATVQLHGYSTILGTVSVILLGLFGLGIIFAMVRPERGLPDLIAGTCLVTK